MLLNCTSRTGSQESSAAIRKKVLREKKKRAIRMTYLGRTAAFPNESTRFDIGLSMDPSGPHPPFIFAISLRRFDIVRERKCRCFVSSVHMYVRMYHKCKLYRCTRCIDVVDRVMIV